MIFVGFLQTELGIVLLEALVNLLDASDKVLELNVFLFYDLFVLIRTTRDNENK